MLDSDYLKRVVYDLIFFRRSALAETAWLRDKRHNDDLVPALDRQIEAIINLFEKYHKVSYDTQGLRDKGIDVLLRYQFEIEEPITEYIGFQIKSYDDLKSKGWLTKLKAQVFEAQSLISPQDLYVLVCTDLSEHYDKLRNINAELAKAEHIHVVRPEFVHTFLNLPPQRIAAYLKVKLSSEDLVFREAIESLQEPNITQSAMVIELAVAYFLEGKTELFVKDLVNSIFVQSVYDNYPYLPTEFFDGYVEREDIEAPELQQDQFQNDLDALNLGVFSIDVHRDQIRLFLADLLPLGALILDGHVRYGYESDVLKEYLLSALVGDKIRKAEDYQAWYEDHQAVDAKP